MGNVKKNYSFSIAGVTFDVANLKRAYPDGKLYRKFISTKKLALMCQFVMMPVMPVHVPAESVFDPAGNWRFFKAGKNNILQLGITASPEDTIVFNKDYSHAHIYPAGHRELFRRFVDQFTLINILSLHQGFLLHAAGVVDTGTGYVFIGQSGSGKSTIVKNYKKCVPKAILLNDDRVAVRFEKKQWMVHGTPWHGDYPCGSPERAPLKALIFIKQAKKNTVTPLKKTDALKRLLVHGLLPYWDEAAVNRVITVFEKLVDTMPAYELGSVPGKAAIQLVRSLGV